MTLVKMIGVGVLGLCAALVAPSCATPGSEGTDSNTHWLDQCQTDQDCGTLSCVCGVCTKPCAADTECAALGETGSCVESACRAYSSVTKTTTVCTLPCTTTADCTKGGRALTCRRRQCEPNGPDGVVVLDGGVCPSTIGIGDRCAPGDSCTYPCAPGEGEHGLWCDGTRWQGTTYDAACPGDGGADAAPASGGACDPSVKSGAACAGDVSQCWGPCVVGQGGAFHSQFVCSGGQWLAGKGLFPCGLDGGAPDAALVDAGKDPCAPMDAFPGVTADCVGPTLYKWDGTSCAPIGCGCVGKDCNARYATEAECQVARAGCLAHEGLSTACTGSVECTLANRGCCAPCQVPQISDSIALNVSSTAVWQASLACDGAGAGACLLCLPPPGTIEALCRIGQCTSVNLAPYAPCLKDDDCILIGKDCCACGGLTDPSSVVAINGSMSGQYVAGTCGTNAKCGVCTNPPEHPPGIAAKCNTSGGYCYAAPTP